MVHPILNGYSIKFTSEANDNLLNLEKNDYLKVVSKIKCLTSDCLNLNIKKLKLKKVNLYRLRVGDFRIIYSIESEQIVVWIIAIGLRKDIYKRIVRFLNL